MPDIRNVTLRFPEKTVLAHFSLSLPQGVTTCVLGPSGCGKTTLLRVASGLLKPDEGEVVLPAEYRFSFVFQEDRLLPWYGALENLTCLGIGATQAQRALDAVLLSEEAHTAVSDLSGGMRRRLSIARAIAFGGDMLFLDEPLRGLDSLTAAPVLAALSGALKGRGGLLITHRPDEALALGDTFCLVDGPPIRIRKTARREDFASAGALEAWLEAT